MKKNKINVPAEERKIMKLFEAAGRQSIRKRHTAERTMKVVNFFFRNSDFSMQFITR